MTLFGLLSFILTIAAYPPYVRAMIKGTTKPKRSSWFIWASLDIIGFFMVLNMGTVNWLLLAFSVGASMIAILSIWYGSSGWDKIDTISLVIAVLSAIVWVAVGPEIGVVCMLIGATVGSVPTIVSVFRGKNEDLLAWILVLISTTCSLFDGNVLVSVWYIVMQLTIILPVVYHKSKREASPIG